MVLDGSVVVLFGVLSGVFILVLIMFKVIEKCYKNELKILKW